jgi:hypothetical protein
MKHSQQISVILITSSILFLNSLSFSQSWNSLSTGINGTVKAVVVYNGQLVAAGSFSSPSINIARWNGTSWTSLGIGVNGIVNALTIFNNELIAGGSFTSAGGINVSNIARWNGNNWNPVGLGVNDSVFALTVYSSALRAGGKFTTAGGINCNRVAYWNGTSWSQMPTTGPNGTNNTVYALTVFGSDLIIGGIFTTVGNNISANRIVRYTAGTGGYFTAMGLGVDDNAVLSLGVYNSQLYAGGSFSAIGGITVNNIARWNGSNWNTVSTGTSGPVKSFTIYSSNLIVGGTFLNAGTTNNVNNIASWNGTTFSALSNGITGSGATVNALTVWSAVLIAAGNFTNAGQFPVPANNVAAYGSIPAAPLLISPANGATGVSLTPTLDWSDVTGASTYGVQLSTHPGFVFNIVNVSGLGTSQYTVGPSVLSNNVTYYWRARASNGIGTGPFSLVRFFTTGLVGIINNSEIPLKFKLYQNYPNPFNPTTKIKFDLPHSSGSNAVISLKVYDILGNLIEELINTSYIAGKWEIDFGANNLSSGIYFYKIEADGYTSVGKMTLLK